MITQQAQIKINLPYQLKDFAQRKAARYGVPLAGYIKHLILNDVKDDQYPTFEMSERSKKKLDSALKNEDKAVIVKDVKKFFDNL